MPLNTTTPTTNPAKAQDMSSQVVISKTFLTWIIILAILVPVGFGFYLAFITKPVPEVPLDAKIRFESMLLGNGKEAQRKVTCVRVRNNSASDWRNLSIGLNKNIRLNQTEGTDSQFYATEPAGIKAGEERCIPLEAFVARNGSVPFPAGTREVKHVTVLAQIPSGARAVAEFPIPSGQDRPSETKSKEVGSDSEASVWIAPAARENPSN